MAIDWSVGSRPNRGGVRSLIRGERSATRARALRVAWTRFAFGHGSVRSMELDGQVAIVTGAASGIGRATVVALIEQGAEIVAVDLDAEGLDSTVRQLGRERVRTVVGDVADRSTALAAVEAAVRWFGRVTALVNNAAVSLPGSVLDLPVDDLDRSYAVNVRGPFLMCQAVLPHLRMQGAGAVVNVGSVNSFFAERQLAAYCTSKGALLMLTRSLAVDLAHEGIRCNIVCPGYVDTPLNRAHAELLGGHDTVRKLVQSWQPIGRDGRAEEVAEVIAFLISDRSSFMTGSVVTVDGGLTTGL